MRRRKEGDLRAHSLKGRSCHRSGQKTKNGAKASIQVLCAVRLIQAVYRRSEPSIERLLLVTLTVGIGRETRTWEEGESKRAENSSRSRGLTVAGKANIVGGSTNLKHLSTT